MSLPLQARIRWEAEECDNLLDAFFGRRFDLEEGENVVVAVDPDERILEAV